MTFRRYALTVFWLLALGLIAAFVVSAAAPTARALALCVGFAIGFAVVWIGLAPTRRIGRWE